MCKDNVVAIQKPMSSRILCILFCFTIQVSSACVCNWDYRLGYTYQTYLNIQSSCVGKVVECRKSDRYNIYRVKVMRVFKGRFDSVITVKTSRESAFCGMEFALNQIYLMEVHKRGFDYFTSSCAWNEPAGRFDRDTTFLAAMSQKNGAVNLPEVKGFMANGKPQGVWKYYERDSKGEYHVYDEMSYNNGLLEGDRKRYSNIPQMKADLVYKKGRIISQITYYASGAKYFEYQRNVSTVLYSEEGTITKKTVPVVFRSHRTLYYPSGKVKETFSLKHNWIRGKWTKYKEDGSVKSEERISKRESYQRDLFAE